MCAMSDERLRELERSWKESGAVEDEAAFLSERVRVGDLSSEQLQLAAYLNHPAAVSGLDELAPEVPEDPAAWFNGLTACPQAQERALIACIRCEIEALGPIYAEISSNLGSFTRERNVLAVCEGALVDGASQFRTEIEQVIQELSLVYEDFAVSKGTAERPRSPIGRKFTVNRMLGQLACILSGINHRYFSPDSDPTPRDTVRSELLTWALGQRDPVRERVEARRLEREQGQVREKMENAIDGDVIIELNEEQ